MFVIPGTYTYANCSRLRDVNTDTGHRSVFLQWLQPASALSNHPVISTTDAMNITSPSPICTGVSELTLFFYFQFNIPRVFILPILYGVDWSLSLVAFYVSVVFCSAFRQLLPFVVNLLFNTFAWKVYLRSM